MLIRQFDFNFGAGNPPKEKWIRVEAHRAQIVLDELCHRDNPKPMNSRPYLSVSRETVAQFKRRKYLF